MRVGLIVLLLVVGSAQAQQPIDGVDARSNPAEFAKELGSSDAHVRQRSAEALARLAATDQRKLVEGYQFQEKNKEVRLALDWALYRMGRSEALYRIVNELDSGRQEQVIGYLSELESPDVLTSPAWDKAIEDGRWPSQVRPHTKNRRHVLLKLMD